MKLVYFVLAFSFHPAWSNEEVVAKVNGTVITMAEVQEYYTETLKYVSNRKMTLEIALEDLINRQVGIDLANKNNLAADPDVKKKRDDILYHAQISNDLENRFKAITVSDEDVVQYYKTNKEYRTAHILFRLPISPTTEQLEQATQTSKSVYEKILADPNQFPVLAEQYSQSTTAVEGGEVGFQPPSALAPEYYEAIKGKKAGDITTPVRSQYGIHIIKVLGVKDFKDINSFVYKKIIYDQKRDKIMGDYFSGIKKKSKIEIFREKLKTP